MSVIKFEARSSFTLSFKQLSFNRDRAMSKEGMLIVNFGPFSQEIVATTPILIKSQLLMSRTIGHILSKTKSGANFCKIDL